MTIGLWINDMESLKVKNKTVILEEKLHFNEGPWPQWLLESGEFVNVNIIDVAPISFPQAYYSILTLEGVELANIDNLQSLPDELLKNIKLFLRNKNFFYKIVSVNSIAESLELRCFNVVTNRGEKLFYMDLDQWPQVFSGGRIIFKDIFGDLYEIENQSQLSEQSKKLIQFLC
jgi:hypothetical protein